MIKEPDQLEGSDSDDEEVANQSVHFALQQDKHSGYYTLAYNLKHKVRFQPIKLIYHKH